MACLVTPPASSFAKLSRTVFSTRKRAQAKVLRSGELTGKWASAPWKSKQIQCEASTLKQTKLLTALELQDRFGSENLQFAEVAGMTVAEVKFKTGTSARILVNEARITSYKCRLWHRSCEEFFHTDVLEQAANVPNEHTLMADSPSFLVTGGMSLSFAYSHPPQSLLFRDSWFLESVKVDPHEYIQVILRFSDQSEHAGDGGQFSLQNIITLTNTFLASAVLLTNLDKRPLTFTGSVSTHMAIAATEALSAFGLQGCRYFSTSENARKQVEAKSLWGKLTRLVSPRTANPDGTTEERNGQPYWFAERPQAFVSFRNGSHKVYSEPPKQFRLTDQGLRRSLLFESHGFENLELSSPETDGEKPYISIGSSSFLSPITLHPNESWRGAQVLTPDT